MSRVYTFIALYQRQSLRERCGENRQAVITRSDHIPDFSLKLLNYTDMTIAANFKKIGLKCKYISKKINKYVYKRIQRIKSSYCLVKITAPPLNSEHLLTPF